MRVGSGDGLRALLGWWTRATRGSEPQLSSTSTPLQASVNGAALLDFNSLEMAGGTTGPVRGNRLIMYQWHQNPVEESAKG